MYKITEFAKMTGIETSKVRYYEKQGVFHNKREVNGYRVFDEYDAYAMNSFRSLQARGYSIKDGKNAMDGQGEEKAIIQLNKNKEILDKKIYLLNAQRKYIEETENWIQENLQNPLKIWEEDYGDYYLLPASFGNDFSIARKNVEIRKQWQSFLPCTRFAGYITREQLCGNTSFIPDAVEIVNEEDFKALNYLNDDTVLKIKLRKCVCFFGSEEVDESIHLSKYPYVEKYLQENNMTIREGAIMFYYMMSLEKLGNSAGVVVIPVE